MRNLKQEEFDQINHLEHIFYMAHTQHFLRNVQTDEFQTVKSLYVNCTGSTEKFEMNCADCITNLYSKMYTLLMSSKKELEDAKYLQPVNLKTKKTK